MTRAIRVRSGQHLRVQRNKSRLLACPWSVASLAKKRHKDRDVAGDSVPPAQRRERVRVRELGGLILPIAGQPGSGRRQQHCQQIKKPITRYFSWSFSLRLVAIERDKN